MFELQTFFSPLLPFSSLTGTVTAVHDGCTTDALKKRSLVRKAPDPDKCFTVLGTKRNVDLECRSTLERDNWVKGLRGLIVHRRENRIY